MDPVSLLVGAGVRDAALAFLAAVVGALLLLAVAFGLYAILLRARHTRRSRDWEALTRRWQEPLLAALVDPEAAHRVHALVDEDHRLHFVRFCLEYARRVRGEEREVVKALARPYLTPLRERASHRDVEVRTRAVQTLGTLGLPDHADVLVEALDDPAPLVAMVAARSLAHHGDPAYAGEILARLGRFKGWSRPFMASMLASMGPGAAPALRATFEDEREIPWVRSVAADALWQLRDLPAGDIAARVVELEEDPDLLASALRLLTAVGRPEHVEIIRVRCASPDAQVRSNALSALGTLANEDDVPRLLGAMSDPSPWVAIHAARGLLAAGGLQLLQDLADSDHPRALLAGQILLEEVGEGIP